MSERSITVTVRGRVQGVGFRWWTARQARELGLVGYARNLPDGGVEVLAQGDGRDVDELLERLGADPSGHRRPGQVTGLTTPERREPDPGLDRFRER